MKANLSEIRKRACPVTQYIESLEQPFHEKFIARKQLYQLKKEALNKLKKFANKYLILVFSAEWCIDCTANVPVLALISEKTGLEVRVLGGLKKDPLSTERKWRIPPSPPEVDIFRVDKIPLIILFDKEGNEVGRVVENPREKPTLEEELLKIILKEQQ